MEFAGETDRAGQRVNNLSLAVGLQLLQPDSRRAGRLRHRRFAPVAFAIFRISISRCLACWLRRLIGSFAAISS
jgi:hypothetical protein